MVTVKKEGDVEIHFIVLSMTETLIDGFMRILEFKDQIIKGL